MTSPRRCGTNAGRISRQTRLYARYDVLCTYLVVGGGVSLRGVGHSIHPGVNSPSRRLCHPAPPAWEAERLFTVNLDKSPHVSPVSSWRTNHHIVCAMLMMKYVNVIACESAKLSSCICMYITAKGQHHSSNIFLFQLKKTPKIRGSFAINPSFQSTLKTL